MINRYVIEKDEWDFTFLGIATHTCIWLLSILLITIFSSLDGYSASRGFKFTLGLLMSLLFTIIAIHSSFTYQKEDSSIIHIGKHLFFSLRSMQASGLRVLSIFLWKQTILTIIKKDKCINIRHSPFIKWIDLQNYHKHSKEDCV